MKKFLVLIPIFLIGIVSVFSFKDEEKKKELTIKNNAISYTIDEESVSEVPKKEDGYIVNKIECKNNSNLVWDNTNWQVELHNLTSTDSCKIDFTSDTNTSGYRVTIIDTSNLIESTSKATINGGNISFNVKSGNITNVTGCTGVIENNTLKINNVTSNETCTVTISGDTGSFVAGTIGYKILQDNPTRLTRSDFSTVLTTDNTGTLYTQSGNFTEGGATVYYFAGNAQNNWVKFGQDSSGNDLYWRIIRTNEDGGVRLLYAGTSMDTTAGYINGTTQAYNSTYSNTMYVGYMYGTTGSLANNRNNTTSSLIKSTIDTWYANGLNTKTDGTYTYDSYISKTAIYCNDRATSSYASSGTMYYAAYDRLYTNKQPSYKCGVTYAGALYESTQASADKFSVNTSSGGNGKLTYPVALMTADEVAYAGGVYGTNAATWYYYNSVSGSVVGSSLWWTMSPYHYSGSFASVFVVHGSALPGRLYGSLYVDYTNSGARPVVSLKSCALVSSGDGSTSSPYTISITSACASANN